MTTYILRLSILYLSLRVRVRMFIMASQTAGPICIKLGMGTWVDPGNILGEVKVKVERRRRENRGAARRRYVGSQIERRRRENRGADREMGASGGWVTTAS